jgi:hypothetical protein
MLAHHGAIRRESAFVVFGDVSTDATTSTLSTKAILGTTNAPAAVEVKLHGGTREFIDRDAL